MNKSPESPILSDEHYKFLQLDQVKRDEKSLREFNAELLQRVGDYRKKNLEFSSNENALKTELAAQAKRFSDREKELNLKFQRDFEQLKKTLEDDRITNEQSVEEWNRKLAKLSDESWAKGLEIESLRRTETEIQEKISRLQEQVARTLAAEASQRSELEAALESEEALRVQLEESNKALETLRAETSAERKSAIEAQLSLKARVESQTRDAQAAVIVAQNQHAQLAETFRTREAELITAFEALRTEYSNIDTCYKESNETITQIRSELHAREEAHQGALIEQEKNLRAAYELETKETTTENVKLREMLSVRDTRLDADRAALQTWREQLGYLDQHLRQLSDSMKKSRADVLRTAKAVSEEVQFNLNHPFTEYLEIAEKEVKHIESQLENTSQMAPLRSKLESRHLSAKSHRDEILEILSQAKGGLSEHAKTIQTILKNLETITL